MTEQEKLGNQILRVAKNNGVAAHVAHDWIIVNPSRANLIK